ncbi:MAG: DNA replication protein [Rhodospirillaceae bacterium]|nr:DNA replication protein [Rhodospirillaceae bacterium]MCK5545994.1 DNA replication protein [Rhodospirillaceae bacterium]
MNTHEQIPMTFGHRPALSGDDFLVAPSNQQAVQWIDNWPNWPGPLLVIVGPAGSGKTHIANVFINATGAKNVGIDMLGARDPAAVVEGATALVVENAKGFINGGLDEQLLHLYNLAREHDIRILMTAETAPARWQVNLKDLSSRLNTAPIAEINPPDDALISALLIKQFSDRQIDVGQDVISYLLSRMGRSFADVRRVVESTDHLSLAEKRRVTIPLVRRVLEDNSEN